jgi:NAD(P)-dependent dehydrogenase (short-subunit alcohol dehydrogenase family)
VAGLLRWCDGSSAEQLSRKRHCDAIARLHGRGNLAYLGGNDFSGHYLLAQVLSLDLTGIRKLDCPLIIFSGRYDFNVNSQIAADWFAKVKAPSKQFVWFENSAHLPMTEDIFVSNAGTFLFKPIEEFSLDDFNRIVAVDLRGAYVVHCASKAFRITTVGSDRKDIAKPVLLKVISGTPH